MSTTASRPAHQPTALFRTGYEPDGKDDLGYHPLGPVGGKPSVWHEPLPVDPALSAYDLEPGVPVCRLPDERVTHRLTRAIRDYLPPAFDLSLDLKGSNPHHGASDWGVSDKCQPHYVQRHKTELVLDLGLKGDSILWASWRIALLRQHYADVRPDRAHPGVTIVTYLGNATPLDIRLRSIENRILVSLNRTIKPCNVHIYSPQDPEAVAAKLPPNYSLVVLDVDTGKSGRSLRVTLAVPGEQADKNGTTDIFTNRLA